MDNKHAWSKKVHPDLEASSSTFLVMAHGVLKSFNFSIKTNIVLVAVTLQLSPRVIVYSIHSTYPTPPYHWPQSISMTQVKPSLWAHLLTTSSLYTSDLAALETQSIPEILAVPPNDHLTIQSTLLLPSLDLAISFSIMLAILACMLYRNPYQLKILFTD